MLLNHCPKGTGKQNPYTIHLKAEGKDEEEFQSSRALIKT